MRERLRMRSLVVAHVAAGALLFAGVPEAAEAQTARPQDPVPRVVAPCPTVSPARIVCQRSDACLYAQLQQLAEASDEYLYALQRLARNFVYRPMAKPVLERWQEIRRLAKLGDQAPRDEVCRALAGSAELLQRSQDLKSRYLDDFLGL